MAAAGAFRSTTDDLLKYTSANLGFLHTKLDGAIQLYHLIIHSIIPANPMNYSEYVALDWRGTHVILEQKPCLMREQSMGGML